MSTKQKQTQAQKQKKKKFIEHLAIFLVRDEALKSMTLEAEQRRAPFAGSPRFAEEWADLRNASPLFGYVDKQEAIKQLTEFLK